MSIDSAQVLAERLLARDVTLWPDGSEAPDRLGWLDVHRRIADEAGELRAWAKTITASKIVLCGMGGSSLGPEVLRSAENNDRLFVLDTTDPQTVASVDLSDAFIIVSSKSGTTLEPNALFAHCWGRVPDGSRYAAVTDDDVHTQRTDATDRSQAAQVPEVVGADLEPAATQATSRDHHRHALETHDQHDDYVPYHAHLPRTYANEVALPPLLRIRRP